MANRKSMRAYKALIDKHCDGTPVDCEITTQKNSHVRFVFTCGDEKRILSSGGSPSDKRALKNCEASVKRIVRELSELHEAAVA